MNIRRKAMLAGMIPLLFAIPQSWAHVHPAPASTSMTIAPAATAASTVTGESAATPSCGHHKKPDFKSQMDKVMADMHKGMMNAPLTGNKEIDFLKLMIPHHQSAIDMADVILETSRDTEVIELAKAIIAEQQKEIDLMNQLIKVRTQAE